MKLVLLSLSLFMLNAFAVSVKDCPAKITVSYVEGRATKSLEAVQAEVSEQGADDKLDATKVAYDIFDKQYGISRTWELEIAKNGRCVYSPGAKVDSEEKAEFYSSKGRDRMYVQTEIGPKGILARVYASLDVLRPNFVRVGSTGSATLAVPRSNYDSYYAGGPLVSIGTASQFRVIAEK